MKKIILTSSLLFLASCATNYQNGVSLWVENGSSPELMETQKHERYVLVDTEPEEELLNYKASSARSLQSFRQDNTHKDLEFNYRASAPNRKILSSTKYADCKKVLSYRDGRTVKSSILCGNQFNKNLITQIRTRLVEAGYRVGSSTDYLDAQTLNALGQYQASQDLAIGAVTLETLNALNIYSY